jgi:DNA-directed RNA polymerase subunit alpha
MAIFNFQKPDKVIMIDSTDFEGKFELTLEPGYGLTVGNALRRVCFQH